MTKQELFDLFDIEDDAFIVICKDIYCRAEVLTFMQDEIGEVIDDLIVNAHYLEPELNPETDYPNVLIYRHSELDCTRSSNGPTVSCSDFIKAVGIVLDPPVFELPPMELLLS